MTTENLILCWLIFAIGGILGLILTLKDNNIKIVYFIQPPYTYGYKVKINTEGMQIGEKLDCIILEKNEVLITYPKK